LSCRSSAECCQITHLTRPSIAQSLLGRDITIYGDGS
jgi:UDP-glucuronate decarboxylase